MIGLIAPQVVGKESDELRELVKTLVASINENNELTTQNNELMLKYTRALYVLTLIMVVLVIVQIFIAVWK
jgi:hypothetical protein